MSFDTVTANAPILVCISGGLEIVSGILQREMTRDQQKRHMSGNWATNRSAHRGSHKYVLHMTAE